MSLSPLPDSSFAFLWSEVARPRSASQIGVFLETFRNYLTVLGEWELTPELRQKVGVSDLVQETMLRAARGFDEFHGATEAELKAWLKQILRNECRVMKRSFLSAKRDVRLEKRNARSSIEDGGDFVCRSPSPSQTAMKAEEAERLLGLLAQLSPEHRLVIRLRQWEGLGFEEIGARMQRTEDAARKLWVRAIQSLGQLMKEKPADG